MPWIETEPMNEKVKFISSYLDNNYYSFQELCQRFNISTKTGYKYVNRYEELGVEGLKERSRAPINPGNQMADWVSSCILDVKHQYPFWGGKKILNWLKQERKEVNWPAKSTIDELLKRKGLVRPAKRKRRVSPYKEPFVLCENPNDTWSIDYKGQFILGNKETCYPLAITDNFRRYLFAVEGMRRISGLSTQQILTNLFIEFGMPQAIRSDNGSPFASHGLAGLSSLSVWLLKLGITPERIRKGHPEENGRHERMHLTLKKETAMPPKKTQREQQKCFDRFKQMFNEERPHEGINFQRPTWLYRSSERQFPQKLRAIEYGAGFQETRKIRTNGTMKWKGKEIFVSETLIGERVGMKPFSEDEWLVHFTSMPIGLFSEKTLKVSKI